MHHAICRLRTVVPAQSESEFGVPRNSFMLLTAFVVAFGLVKGTLNFVAGRLSERMAWWLLSAAVSGFGMALLYPNHSAAVADISHPNWRGSVEAAFWFVAVSIFLSGSVLWTFGEETLPRINPATVMANNSMDSGPSTTLNKKGI